MTTLLLASGIYILAVLAVGLSANKRSSQSPEEYFLAGRKLGTFVLFMALFGTNCTAFVLVGIPGQAYHDGVGIFGVNAPIIALVVPLTFWAIGSPARRMAGRLDAMTPAELYARRFNSRRLGILLFVVFTAYTLPYMASALKGAAITLAHVTGGAIPEWAGALGAMVLALTYTALGGMRATAWTNVMQGSIFLLFMVSAFFLVSQSMGGLEAAMERVRRLNADLLVVGEGRYFSPKAWFSWSIVISLTVVAFPHMLVRLMSAEDDRALKGAARLYPPALILLWLPAVLLGVWGAALHPGLEGRMSDEIFSRIIRDMPVLLTAVGFLAVLAAVMSTLDAQILTLSSMLTRDVLQNPKNQVRTGRLFAMLFAVAAFLATLWGASIFQIARFAFSGYVTLVPTLYLGVRWQRFTVQGAIASIVCGNLVLVLAKLGWWPLFGFLEGLWGFGVALVVALGVSLVTPPADADTTRHAFGDGSIQ